ncbi:tyrosine-type recombinase/integrase [Arthrobacter sp. H14]|uniref:tyrosine-type recombinase/integrase n=1 Tax=Arthrobacter sp. H14 TaxID=1312959 RepID=UPI0020A632F9|nr:site-specific integrase [Arthrobacter sp. H14]
MSITKRPNGMWRARYRDGDGKEHARHFPRKLDAQKWMDTVTASVVRGDYVDPKTAKLTVGEWCATWLHGYGTKRSSTVRQARTHAKHIVAAFGNRPLGQLRPSEVRAWTVKLKNEGYADSTVYALHSRLGQIMTDAVHDGIIPRSPVSRRTSPGAGKQRPYVATTAQVWALHDAMPDSMRPAVLLAAFAGLRVAEAVALRTGDVDFMRGIITPSVQYPSEPLKTEISRMPIPIPRDLATDLNRVPVKWGTTALVTGEFGRSIAPYTLETAFRTARATVEGLPEGFRYHDLRHYFASLLIAAGLDIKTVQARLRHASAKTTLDTYGHMWPDKDESARAAIQDVLTARADSVRTEAATSQ